MLDKNGIEIRTGDIVEVSGAYFKNDNGLYFVDNSPGDPTWSGSDYSLHKIGKTGKISTAKYSVAFWPLSCVCSDRAKNAAAREWNSEHAQIEVKLLANMAEVRQHFTDNADRLAAKIKREIWDFGEESETIAQWRAMLCHYGAVLDRIPQ